MENALVTVIGGTGFLGRYVVQELVNKGYRVQVIARHASRARHLIPLAAKGPVTLRDGDVTRPKTIHGALEGSHAVINLVGILYEKKRQRFSTLHAQCPERLAQMAKEAGITRFIHISAIGSDKASRSAYARTKATGEKAVRSILPNAVIIRPSILFGAEDNFFNQFAHMATLSPFLPLIGGGKTRFQPVYVQDVAYAVVKTVDTPSSSGKTYELGGPRTYSFRELLKYMMQVTGQKRTLVRIPWFPARIIGFFAEWLPTPPLTRDQVTLLKYDNTVNPELDGLRALGIQPTPLELVVPEYLAHYRHKTPHDPTSHDTPTRAAA